MLATTAGPHGVTPMHLAALLPDGGAMAALLIGASAGGGLCYFAELNMPVLGLLEHARECVPECVMLDWVSVVTLTYAIMGAMPRGQRMGFHLRQLAVCAGRQVWASVCVCVSLVGAYSVWG